MPTLHEYKNKSGVYVLAMPSDAGNITYQVSHNAEKRIRGLGYGDGDEVPWTVINIFRKVGGIYTKGSGTDSNEAPTGLDAEVLESLSLEQKHKLVMYIFNDNSLADRKKMELMSQVLTVEEWEKLVTKTGNKNRGISEQLEDAVEKYATEHSKSVIKEKARDNRELQKHICEFYEHPWELKRLYYHEDWGLGFRYVHSFEYTCEDAGGDTPIKIIDWRNFDEVNTIPQLDIPGDLHEIDFMFANEFTYTSCMLYVRNGHVILPKHNHVPNTGEYQHAHLRDIVTTYSLCVQFFEGLGSYTLENPTPEPKEP